MATDYGVNRKMQREALDVVLSAKNIFVVPAGSL